MKRLTYFFTFVFVISFIIVVNNILIYKKYGVFKNENLKKLSQMLVKSKYEKAEQLLKTVKFSLDEKNNKDQTLLYMFIKYDKFDAFKWLLEKGADPNILINDREDSAMRQMAECEDSKYLEFALKYRGNPLLVHSGGKRPLYFACVANRLKNVDILIKAGDNGNIADEFQNTTIKCLLLLNKYDCVNVLLDKGINPYQSSKEIRDSIVFFVEMSYPSISSKFLPHFLKTVDKLRLLGFKIELLSSHDYIKRQEERKKGRNFQ